MSEPLLSPQEVAAFSGLSYHSVLREISCGRLRATKRRGHYLIRREWFDAWVDGEDPSEARPETRVVSIPRVPRAQGGGVGSVAHLRAIEAER